MVSAWSRYNEGPLLGCRWPFLHCVLTLQKRQDSYLGSFFFFFKSMNPTFEGLTSWPNHLLNVPPPNIILLVVRMSTYFWKNINIQFLTSLSSFAGISCLSYFYWLAGSYFVVGKNTNSIEFTISMWSKKNLQHWKSIIKTQAVVGIKSKTSSTSHIVKPMCYPWHLAIWFSAVIILMTTGWLKACNDNKHTWSCYCMK